MTIIKNKPYFFVEGAKQLTKELKGDENIYLGIRPYGFHSGNQIPFNVYPDLLCEFIQKRNIEPKFNFYVFINDWEQDGFAEDKDFLKEYPFNISPKKTTFQFLVEKEKNISLVEHWESIILDSLYKNIKSKYKKISIFPVRNSHMRNNKHMKEVVLKTIKNPDLVINILRKYSGKKILPKTHYCKAICPKCKTALVNNEVVDNDNIKIKCNNCDFHAIRNYHTLNFWLYHKPLALPRIKEYNIDLCITGTDHYKEGDFIVRQKLFEAYGIDIRMPKTLYTQALYGRNGKPMGKSKGNAEIIDYNLLKNLVLNTDKNESVVKIL